MLTTLSVMWAAKHCSILFATILQQVVRFLLCKWSKAIFPIISHFHQSQEEENETTAEENKKWNIRLKQRRSIRIIYIIDKHQILLL